MIKARREDDGMLMITNFKSNSFKRVFDWIIILLMYISLFRYPCTYLFNSNAIFQFNIKKLNQVVINDLISVVLLSASLTVAIISIFNEYVGKLNFRENSKFHKNIIEFYNCKLRKEENALDLSKSFLYAYKTIKLLE